MKIRSGTGFMLAISYLFVAMSSIIYAIMQFTILPPRSAFSGLHLFFVTLPWSVVLTILFDYLHIQDKIPVIMKFGLFVVYAFINAYALYWLGYLVDGGDDKSDMSS